MTEPIEPSAAKQLRDAILRLEMISQASAANLGRSSKSTDDEQGGRRPSGGIDRKDDRERDFALKSVDHYRKREARCHTDGQRFALLKEVQATLKAWRFTPIPQGQEPEYGSPQWKRWVAESDLDGGTLARKFNVTRQRIYQIRRDYRRDQAA